MVYIATTIISKQVLKQIYVSGIDKKGEGQNHIIIT